MSKLPVIKGKDFVKFLQSIGFNIIRTRGSHVRLKAEDGRITTVPIHSNKNLPKGLLRKIIREDLELSLEEFIRIFDKYKKR